MSTIQELSEQINCHHENAKLQADKFFDHSIQAGRLLLKVSTMISGKEWRIWLEENFQGYSKQAAYYICLAEEYNDNFFLKKLRSFHQLVDEIGCPEVVKDDQIANALKHADPEWLPKRPKDILIGQAHDHRDEEYIVIQRDKENPDFYHVIADLSGLFIHPEKSATYSCIAHPRKPIKGSLIPFLFRIPMLYKITLEPEKANWQLLCVQDNLVKEKVKKLCGDVYQADDFSIGNIPTKFRLATSTMPIF